MADLTDATASLTLPHVPSADDLSPIEADVLEEYERLADNMKRVRPPIPSIPPHLQSSVLTALYTTRLRGTPANTQKLASLLDGLSGAPTAEILDGLLQLERKTSLVFTLLKASVYSIVLQQEIYSGDQMGGEEGQ
jgi:DASH complex subunit DAD3